MKINLRIIAFILTAINVFIASWFFINGDIVFHTDIARDFLLFEDIVKNRDIALLGPRSGGIPGVFHGPAWLYLNLPAFIIGGGNPVAVGWFWLLLFIASIGIVYWVAKKMFDEEVGWLAALIFSLVTADSVRSMFNPYGAVLLAPLFFYFFWKYVQKHQLKDILITYFVLGLMIQFQMAFGGPILILTFPYLLYSVIKHKHWKHLLSPFILLIPLSTFFAFDLKNNFLQARSVLNYLSGAEIAGKVNTPFNELIWKRWHGLIFDNPALITQGTTWMNWLFLACFAFVIYQLYRHKDSKYRNMFVIFFVFYIGYWMISLLYKGVMWSYYYWPFVGVLAIFFAAIRKFMFKPVFYIIFAIIYISILYPLVLKTVSFQGYFAKDNSSWKFRRLAAERIYKDAPAEFGYYIFTADQFGYPSRYAMNFVQNKYPDKKAVPYEKRKTTYLLIDPSTLSFYNEDSWTKGDIKIDKKPAEVFKFATNFIVRKYHLTDEEIKVPSNPDLIHTLIFR